MESYVPTKLKSSIGTCPRHLTRRARLVPHCLPLRIERAMMATENLTKQLTDEEYGEIDQVLARVRGGAISNVEALDGFLTALEGA